MKAGGETWVASKRKDWPPLTIWMETGTLKGRGMNSAVSWDKPGKDLSPESPEKDSALHIPWLCSHETHRVNKTCLERRRLEENRGPLKYSVPETILGVCGGHMNLWWLSGKQSACQCQRWVCSLGWEDLLEKETATHSSIPAWEIPWTEEPGGLQVHEASASGRDMLNDWATTKTKASQWDSFLQIGKPSCGRFS